MSAARRRSLALLALVTIWLVWGSTYLAIRVVVHELPPFAAAALRFVIAGAVMTGVAAAVDRRRPTARQVRDYGLVGVLLLGFGNGLVMWAEKTVPSGTAALLVATVPLWITLLDSVRPGGRRATGAVWTGTAIGLLGVAFVVRPEGGMDASQLGPVVALQAACLSWTVGSLYVQNSRDKLPVFTASAVEMLVGSVALAAFSVLAAEPWGAFATASPQAWGGLAYLTVMGSLVGFTAFAFCLDQLPASLVGTYAYVNPVVAVILGAALLGEPLSAGILAGGALIVVAVVVTTRANRPSRAPEPEVELIPEKADAA